MYVYIEYAAQDEGRSGRNEEFWKAALLLYSAAKLMYHITSGILLASRMCILLVPFLV